MRYLFNISGTHIANEVDGQLYSTKGKNIGHFLPDFNFFIDMKGYYLGEVFLENRLLFKENNGYGTSCFGAYGDYGNVGDFGNPGNFGSIGHIGGYSDIAIGKLK